jgi:hypothetical protein
MRTQLNHIHAKPILRILIILGILVQTTFTINSCSSDSNDDNGGIHDDGSLSSLPEYQYWQERYKYYDPADAEERCKNGVVERRCEVDGKEVWYNPLKQDCGYDESCSNNDCERTYYGLYTLVRCGNKIIISDHEYRRCNGGVVEVICKTANGDKWYNTNTHYCDRDYDPETMTRTEELEAKSLCGNVYYVPSHNEVCKNGVAGRMCGGMSGGDEGVWYNNKTHYCKFGYDTETHSYTTTVEPLERCGNVYMDDGPDYQRCNNGVIEESCGYYFPGMPDMEDNRKWYNSMTQTCDRQTYTVRNKVRCGS